MNLRFALKNKDVSGYRLSKQSGIPQTTVADIISGAADILDCSALTVYRLSHVLGLSADELIESAIEQKKLESANRSVFRSNVCHAVSKEGDLSFIKDVLENKRIQKAKEEGRRFEAFYLLGMVDCLCRVNGLPSPSDFACLRKMKLRRQYHPASLSLVSKILPKGEDAMKAINGAIPEFLRFNIVEGDIRNAI